MHAYKIKDPRVSCPAELTFLYDMRMVLRMQKPHEMDFGKFKKALTF